MEELKNTMVSLQEEITQIKEGSTKTAENNL
ncbi:MAG: hypothetical protein PWP27_1719 [Clostridiales bacterium]|jgi:hypothetical protein|nr:hypothetical protein [Clostridiales bacterium]MDK2933909.1 hypothetical protein [Clostridiales bacterium]